MAVPRPSRLEYTGHNIDLADLDEEFAARLFAFIAHFGWLLAIASAVRTAKQQIYLWLGWIHHKLGFNLAANPYLEHPDGTKGSKHEPQGKRQKGFAVDLHRLPGCAPWRTVHHEAPRYGMHFPVKGKHPEAWHITAYAMFKAGVPEYLPIDPAVEPQVQRWRDWIKGIRGEPAPAKGLDAELPTGPLRKGATGEQVAALQRLLNRAGHSNQPVSIDGRYGIQTTGAVARFQQAHGLKPDGIYGPDTRAALKSALTIRGGS